MGCSTKQTHVRDTKPLLIPCVDFSRFGGMTNRNTDKAADQTGAGKEADDLVDLAVNCVMHQFCSQAVLQPDLRDNTNIESSGSMTLSSQLLSRPLLVCLLG